MKHRKLIAGLVLALVFLVALGSFMTYRWVKKAFGGEQSAAAPSSATPSNNN